MTDADADSPDSPDDSAAHVAHVAHVAEDGVTESASAEAPAEPEALPPLQRFAGFAVAALGLVIIVSTLRGLEAITTIWSFDGPWHLNCGRIIVETGTVPRLDPLCFTSAKLDWINLNWLSQVLLFRLFEVFGFAGPVALALMAAGGMVLATICNMQRREVRPLIALPLTLAAVLPALAYTTIRPRTLSFLFIAIELALLAPRRGEDPDRLPPLRVVLLALLLLVWNQLHGGFVYGYAILACDAAGAALARRVERGSAVAPRALALAAVIALGLASFGLHPHGFAALEHALLYPSRIAEFREWIAELTPTDFTGLLGRTVAAQLLLLVAGLALARRRRLRELATILVFLHFTLLYTRMLLIAGLVLTPIAASLLEEVLEDLESAPAVGSPLALLNQLLTPLWRALLWLTVALGLIAAPLSAVLRREVVPAGATGPLLTTPVPVEPIHALRRLGLEGPILNRYGDGGVYGWLLYPEKRLYIDGRGDLHARGETVRDWLAITRMKEGWEATLKRRRVRLAILSPEKDRALISALSGLGWSEAWRGESRLILTAPAEPRADGGD